MKLLTDLRPKFADAGGDGITDLAGYPVPKRTGVGLLCDCPCGCGSKLYVPFHNPLDGGPGLLDTSRSEPGKAGWTRTGETFETLTLTPSIRRIPHDGSCGWHGFIQGGQTVDCSDSLPPTEEFRKRMRELGIEDD